MRIIILFVNVIAHFCFLFFLFCYAKMMNGIKTAIEIINFILYSSKHDIELPQRKVSKGNERSNTGTPKFI